MLISSPSLEFAQPSEHVLNALSRSRREGFQLLPAAAAQAVKCADNPDSTAADLTRILERDVHLATDILTLSNSALYSTVRPVGTLNEAVVRLGFRRCRNLILTSGLLSLLRTMSIDQQWMLEALTSHSFMTGTLASGLNSRLGLGFEGEEFTGGLFHDLGRLILASILPKDFEKADSLSFDEFPEMLDTEIEVLGISHTQLGGWLINQNNLPRYLRSAAQFHHTPDRTEGEQDSILVYTTAASDHMANYYQRSGEGVGYEIASNPFLSRLLELCPRSAAKLTDEFVQELFAAASIDVESLNLG